MLQNSYFLAKIGVDTAENERTFAENLLKICQKLATTLRVHHPTARSVLAGAAARVRGSAPPRGRAPPPRGRAPAPAAVAGPSPIFVLTPSEGSGVMASKICKFYKILQIFGGLVLGCIKTKFCKKIYV